MKNQLVLFDPDLPGTEVVAVLGQLPSEKREMATRLLAELMARSLADSKRERSEVGGKEGADE